SANPDRTLDDIAIGACRCADADLCLVYLWSDEGLVVSGSSDSSRASARPDGFSVWIHETKTPVRLTQIRAADDFQCEYQVSGKWSEKPPTDHRAPPTELGKTASGTYMS